MTFGFSFCQVIYQILIRLSKRSHKLEFIQAGNDLWFFIEFIAQNIDSLSFSITKDSDFIVESDEANFFERVNLLELLKLAFNGTQNALFSRNECFVLVMISRQKVELGFISWLHKLSKHFDFLLRESILKIHFSFDFRSSVHASWNVNAKDYSWVIFSNLAFMCTFEHIYYIVFFGKLFFLDLQNIRVLAKLALPETFIWFKFDFHLKIWFLIILFACKYFWVFVQNRITLFTWIRVTTWKILFCVFHTIEGNNKNIQVLLWLCSWNNKTSKAIIVVVRVKSLLSIEA